MAPPDPRALDGLPGAVAADPALAHTQSLVASQHGTVVLEHHFGGAAPGEPTDVFSITKSVVSTLAGIALDRGELRSLDEPVSALLEDPAAGTITVRHLLTMSTGRSSAAEWDIDAVMERDDSWTRHLLRAPVLDEPGARFRYDNGAAHVLAAALQRATGRTLRELADERLFGPLEIECGGWPADPEGINYGFGHVLLSTRDLVKLGELYLGGGEWRGRRIVSTGYVAAATAVQAVGGPPENLPYGFFWWVDGDNFLAAGYAGQFLLVVPERALVVAGTGDASRLPPSWRNARHVAAAVAR